MVIFGQYRMFSRLPAAYYAVNEVGDAISVTWGELPQNIGLSLSLADAEMKHVMRADEIAYDFVSWLLLGRKCK